MQKTITYTCILLLLLHFKATAQLPGTKIYSIENGNTSQLKINSLCQLANGYILAATSHGLFRFNGLNFEKIYQAHSLPDTVNVVCELNADTTLVGFSNGSIGVLYSNYIQPAVFEEGFPQAAITKIIKAPNGVVWIGTAGEGLYYYKKKRLYNINEDDGLSDLYIYDMLAYSNGSVVASTDRGMNICEAVENHKMVKVISSRNGLADNIVRCLEPAGDKKVWAGMQDAGVACYDLSSMGLSKTKTVWQYGQVNDIVYTNQHLYIATETNGFLSYTLHNGVILNTPPARSEQLKKINCLLYDREGNIWAGGDNKLLRTSGAKLEAIKHFNKKDAENIHCLLWTSDNALWYNEKNSLVKLANTENGLQEQKFALPETFAKNISSLYKDKNGNMWTGSMGGGIILLNTEKTMQTKLAQLPQLLNGNIISLSGTGDTVWISSLEGTLSASVKDQQIQFTSYDHIESIKNKYVYNILPDSRNRVWFATDGNGIALYANKEFKNIPGENEYGTVVYKLVQDKAGNIWFSTFDKGLVKYDGKQFIHYNLDNGLSDMNISGLAVTGNNITVFHKNSIDLLNIATGLVNTIDAEQGIGEINSELNTVTFDNSDNIYFVADSLLYRYNAGANKMMQPEIIIDKVQLFLKDIEIESGHLFGYDENNLGFFFTGIFFSNPSKIKYQYKLEGYDKDWVSTNDHVKNFPRLLPGGYTFKVRVSLNENFSKYSEASFVFSIAKPFWQQWWFLVFCGAVLTGIVYVIIKEREKNINRNNRIEKDKIQSQLQTLRNQINPHFLFNSFNTLISEIEDNPDKAVTYVEHLSDFYRNIVNNREKDLITLQEEIHILNDYCFIQQKRYGNALQIFNRVAETEKRKFLIVPLALQLLFENAVKHNAMSATMPLNIEMYIDDSGKLVVKNNIKEKLNAEKGTSMGLENIQKRYLLLTGKSIEVEKTGSHFIVKIPLLKNIV